MDSNELSAKKRNITDNVLFIIVVVLLPLVCRGPLYLKWLTQMSHQYLYQNQRLVDHLEKWLLCKIIHKPPMNGKIYESD